MKQPLGVPVFTGENKILFCTEGNSTTMLLTHKDGNHHTSNLEFKTPGKALGWCRKNGLMMIYSPRDPSGN